MLTRRLPKLRSNPIRVSQKNERMNNFRPSPLSLILAAGLLLLICLATATVWIGWRELNRNLESRFGPPAPGLGTLQRLRLSALLLLNEQDLTQPVGTSGTGQAIEIRMGQSPLDIARRLQEGGLIRSAEAFTNYLIYSGLDTTLQAGKYRLSPSLSAIEIARALQDATPREVTLTILEGWRLEEIAASLPTTGLEFSPEAFMQAASGRPNNFRFLDQVPETQSVEGLLFPGSYLLPREATAPEVVGMLLDQFRQHLTPEIREGFQHQGLNVYQAVILASIVEREAVVGDEMPLIASVFLNRLALGMPLEADSTVQYALGYQPDQDTWWKNPLAARDLEVDSPHNTYRNPGLPPGPIANPGLTALKAVAFPAQTDYLYFRASCDGSGEHRFAQTFEEHLQNACP